MFKFPYNWLCAESEISISYDEVLEWLDYQGFEIASIEHVNCDKIIEIEVKANRPDMLSVFGVLREIYVSKRGHGKLSTEEIKKISVYKDYSVDMDIMFQNSDVLSHKIYVNSPDVHRYYGLEINGVDNTVTTPDYILDYLEKLGIPHVNAIVDISNYVLLLLGQPTHVFDADKVDGDIVVQNIEKPFEFISLNGSSLTLPKGSLLISDDMGPLCLAGIIGGQKAEISAGTKNIIIESANFDQINIRTVSKQVHVSTMASYRYERGVDSEVCELGITMMSKLILEICGGQLRKTAFRYCDKEYEPRTLELSVTRTNSILGIHLSIDEIADILEQCFLSVEKSSEDILHVIVPSFRLDIDLDVDLIEEVGRIYGYHNIDPQPITLYAPYQENLINKNAHILRDIMVGYGFIEILTYGFIPVNAMDILCIDSNSLFYGDVYIINPLSNHYGLMRPTMAYNMITTAVNNMAIGKYNIRIFELGRCFYRQPGHAEKYEDYYEKNMLAVLLYGYKHQKGFGQEKDIKYCIHDITSVVRNVFGEYNMPVSIRNSICVGFFEEGSGAEILFQDRVIGIVGKLSKKVLKNFENGKLAREDMFYFEFCYDEMLSIKKRIQFESIFPTISREYNFLVKENTSFCEYAKDIYGSSKLIINVTPIDVYHGIGVSKGYSSVLIRVDFNAITRTMTTDEIANVEACFLRVLDDKYNITIKT